MNRMNNLAATALLFMVLVGCTANNGQSTDITACTKTCDDSQTTCTTKCTDDTCKASCTTTHNNCVTQCSHVSVTTSDGG